MCHAGLDAVQWMVNLYIVNLNLNFILLGHMLITGGVIQEFLPPTPPMYSIAQLIKCIIGRTSFTLKR